MAMKALNARACHLPSSRAPAASAPNLCRQRISGYAVKAQNRHRRMPCQPVCTALDGEGITTSDGSPRTLGFGFSAGGMLFPYLIGVMASLRDEGIMTGGE